MCHSEVFSSFGVVITYDMNFESTAELHISQAQLSYIINRSARFILGLPMPHLSCEQYYSRTIHMQGKLRCSDILIANVVVTVCNFNTQGKRLH